MMQPGRRRFIKIAAYGAAAMAVPFPALALGGKAQAVAGLRPFHWRGMALGAEASMTLYHHDKAQAKKLIRACFAEVQRLEQIFSLYKPDSALSSLNKNGELQNAPAELIEIIQQAASYSALTNGAFDISVQPLWQLYAKHFSKANVSHQAPDDTKIQQALALIDYQKIQIQSDHIRLTKQGMALTLNGIAQGYITDKITALLRTNGLDNILVEMGEMRALGRHPNGQPWRIGIKNPDSPQQLLQTVTLENAALATSGGYGTRFDAAGAHHHLLNPKTGRSANRYKSVSIIAPSATQADALSTAFCMMPASQIASLINTQKPISAHIITDNGEIKRYGWDI
jgi:thiamine biosynthesis lipoprotein